MFADLLVGFTSTPFTARKGFWKRRQDGHDGGCQHDSTDRTGSGGYGRPGYIRQRLAALSNRSHHDKLHCGVMVGL